MPIVSRPLCREARRIWLARLAIHRRARRLTELHVEIARRLLARMGMDGALYPSHERLAKDAGCGISTVQRCLNRLAALGLLTWQQRSAAGRGQTSNAYVIHVDGDAPPIMRLPRRRQPVVQVDRGITDKEDSPLLLPRPEAARLALERVRRGWASRVLLGRCM